MSFACAAGALGEDMDLQSFEIAVGLFDCGRADIVSRGDIGKFSRFYSADPDIVRQLDQDLAGGRRYLKRLLFYCRDLSPNRNRLPLRRLRLRCLELRDAREQGESEKEERSRNYLFKFHWFFPFWRRTGVGFHKTTPHHFPGYSWYGWDWRGEEERVSVSLPCM